MSRLLDWDKPGMKWHRTARSGKRLAESTVTTRLYAAVQQIYSYNTRAETSYSCSRGRSIRRQGNFTQHRRFVMAHNTRATETTLTALSTACVEERFTVKQTAQGILLLLLHPPTLIDYLLVNTQGIVPQDTTIILEMSGYKVTRCMCVCLFV